jgi:hypothetical protein
MLEMSQHGGLISMTSDVHCFQNEIEILIRYYSSPGSEDLRVNGLWRLTWNKPSFKLQFANIQVTALRKITT